MKYESIAEIYAGNEKIRARLRGVLAQLSERQISSLPEGEKWTIAQIVEHIAIVDESTAKICGRLLKKAHAAGRKSEGKVSISETFLQKVVEIAAIKVDAPSFVQPSGNRSILESLENLDQTSERVAELRPLFETVHCPDLTFPHPFFGEITAQEWLALKGGHELRHLKQIEKLIEKIG